MIIIEHKLINYDFVNIKKVFFAYKGQYILNFNKRFLEFREYWSGNTFIKI